MVNDFTNTNLRLVNRIDVDTSGLVIFSKNSADNNIIDSMMEKSHKYYLCLVHGLCPENEFTITNFLKTADGKTQIVRSGGKKAISVCKLLATKNNISLIAVKIITGRRHQIRCHLASLGLPLLADINYGGRKNQYINRCALHAHTIIFPNLPPICAPLPQDFITALNKANIPINNTSYNFF
ncbi:MAG: RluA family pseudouridine synthase, partial [Lentisphaeria bacterium]